MVAIRHSPRNAARRQRLSELANGLAHQRSGMVQRGFGNRFVTPATFTECIGERRIVAGDLVAGENHQIRPCGIKAGLNQGDGVFGDFRPILNVGNLQHAELAGIVELQSSETRRDRDRTAVFGIGRLDTRFRRHPLWRTLCFRHALHCTHKRKGPPERAFSTSSTTGAESLHNIIVVTVSLSNARPT